MKHAMKNLKLALLTATLSFAAVAQDSDPVAEQIRLTQDAVRVALTEVETNNQTQTLRSVDGDAKLELLRRQSVTALRLFEERVRLRILMPLQILISQYNQTHQNTQLPARVKAQTLANLFTQITEMALSRQPDYYQEVVNLHSPMGNFPVSLYVTRNSMNGQFTAHTVQNGLGQSTEIEVSASKSWSENAFDKITLVKNLATHLGERLNQEISRGCYTSTCFYQTLNHHVMWSSLVSASLARALVITLADGKTLTISPENKNTETFSQPTHHLLASSVLTQVKGNGAIFDLPADIREDRRVALQRLEATANATNFVASSCVRSVRTQRDDLCRSSEGCLTASELRVMMARSTAPRAACLDLRLILPSNLNAAFPEMGQGRLSVLERLEAAINAYPFDLRTCQATARTLKRNLCNTRPCLSDSEKQVLIQRLNNPSNAACL